MQENGIQQSREDFNNFVEQRRKTNEAINYILLELEDTCDHKKSRNV
jgi:hypothetical protein